MFASYLGLTLWRVRDTENGDSAAAGGIHPTSWHLRGRHWRIRLSRLAWATQWECLRVWLSERELAKRPAQGAPLNSQGSNNNSSDANDDRQKHRAPWTKLGTFPVDRSRLRRAWIAQDQKLGLRPASLEAHEKTLLKKGANGMRKTSNSACSTSTCCSAGQTLRVVCSSKKVCFLPSVPPFLSPSLPFFLHFVLEHFFWLSAYINCIRDVLLSSTILSLPPRLLPPHP